jgi:hypothetical protein
MPQAPGRCCSRPWPPGERTASCRTPVRTLAAGVVSGVIAAGVLWRPIETSQAGERVTHCDVERCPWQRISEEGFEPAAVERDRLAPAQRAAHRLRSWRRRRSIRWSRCRAAAGGSSRAPSIHAARVLRLSLLRCLRRRRSRGQFCWSNGTSGFSVAACWSHHALPRFIRKLPIILQLIYDFV